jgi:hypothetical protein
MRTNLPQGTTVFLSNDLNASELFPRRVSTPPTSVSDNESEYTKIVDRKGAKTTSEQVGGKVGIVIGLTEKE